MLHYNYKNLPENLRETWWIYNGERKSQLGVKLSRFVWMTLSIQRNLTGGVVKQKEFLKRFNYLKQIGHISKIVFTKELMESQPDYWKGATLNAQGEYEYELTDQDVLDHWGLYTNSNYTDTWTKWKKSIDAELAKRGEPSESAKEQMKMRNQHDLEQNQNCYKTE